jgi:uncharacterized caspase-like protein
MNVLQKVICDLPLWIWVSAAAALLSAPAQAAGQSVALLIGNSAYLNEKPLRNLSNDVELMAWVLRDNLRFNQVIVRKYVGRRDLAEANDQFTVAAKGADVAMVYDSGNVPALESLKINGMSRGQCYAVMARDAAPAGFVDRVSQALRAALAAEPASAQSRELGFVPVPAQAATVDAATAFMRREYSRTKPFLPIFKQ